MHSTACWVPHGKLRNYPKQEEHDMIMEEQPQQNNAMEEDNVISSYNLDNYDNDDDDYMRYALTKHDDDYDPNMDDDSEMEEMLIADTDSILLTGGFDVEEGYYHLDVVVTEKDADNRYTHHDIMLPHIPLTTTYLDMGDTPINNAQNIAAVSCMGNPLELWDIDCLDDTEPLAVLSELPVEKKLNRKEELKNTYNENSSVMSVGWNSLQKNILCTGSADHVVRIYDLTTLKTEISLKHHTGKVQVCSWSPTDASILVTGGFAESGNPASMVVIDAREKKTIGSWFCNFDMNDFVWNNDGRLFITTFENGEVELRDLRALDKPIWSLSAHSKACTSASIGKNGIFATGGEDKHIRIWNAQGGKPTCIKQTAMKGDVLCCSWCPDIDNLLAVGGEFGMKYLRPLL
ncbi:WD-repeat protein [Entamoeba marina]